MMKKEAKLEKKAANKAKENREMLECSIRP